MTPAPNMSNSFRHNENLLSDTKEASLRDSGENNYNYQKMPPIAKVTPNGKGNSQQKSGAIKRVLYTPMPEIPQNEIDKVERALKEIGKEEEMQR